MMINLKKHQSKFKSKENQLRNPQIRLNKKEHWEEVKDFLKSFNTRKNKNNH